MRFASSIAALVLFGATYAAHAAGVPSWRINPITGPASFDPELAGAVSVSLMITLTGSSQFNVAGLDLSALTSRGATIFNHVAGGNHYPLTLPLPIFPSLDYDTYVTGPDRSGAIALAGRFTGPGPAVFGPAEFNVAWGATPNTGSPGTFEIARITMFGVGAIGSTVVVGETRVSDEPSTVNVVPPIPVRIPEPIAASVFAAMIILRRRQS